MKPYPILVGADGTEPSKAAVRWAAREALRRDRPLRVIHVFDGEPEEVRDDVSHGYLDLSRKHAEGVTADAAFEARMVAGPVVVEEDLVVGYPAARLLAESEGVELVVLGCRGRGGFAGLRLGSVSQRVATHASCAVVVVRGRGEAAEGPVVVGVDDSPVADLVLETAFAQADGWGCPLTVVRAFLPELPLWLSNVRAADVPTPGQDAVERARLEQQLAAWREKYPATPVEVVLTHGGVAGPLVEASRLARLVMVGSRGHGVIAGSLLGSAGLQLLHHAECPVYLVRASTRPAP